MASKTTATSPHPPRATPDGEHLPPTHQDSILESLGKAITDPIREASEEDTTDQRSDTTEPADRTARQGH
jgi:hypothetical protein